MDTGPKTSPILIAIQEVSAQTSASVHVHVSKNWLETQTDRAAQCVFEKYALGDSLENNSILIYLNSRKKRFSILADFGALEKIGRPYFLGLANHLEEDLKTTQIDNAVSIAIRTLGATLGKYFPKKS